MYKRNEKRIALFGATGSIGKQTLDVIERLGGFKVVVLSASSSWEELARLAVKWQPEWVVIRDENLKERLHSRLEGLDITILSGDHAASEAAAMADYELCVNGLVGTAGLLPSYHALNRGIDLALANKESLVLAGDLLNAVAKARGVRIRPIDSEHSALLQCLQGEDISSVRRLILTASGGPFRQWPLERINNATRDEALNHPTWRMGPKVTVDSATLMNKGLEVIETYQLFEVPVEKIEVRVHPVSIVHSIVEFVDGSFKAQLGKPDMRLPIQYALTHPERRPLDVGGDDPLKWKTLEFYPVEEERYPCLGLAYHALDMGGTATAALNGADEAAVELFLEGRITFGEIHSTIQRALHEHKVLPADNLDTILNADREARELVRAG